MSLEIVCSSLVAQPAEHLGFEFRNLDKFCISVKKRNLKDTPNGCVIKSINQLYETVARCGLLIACNLQRPHSNYTSIPLLIKWYGLKREGGGSVVSSYSTAVANCQRIKGTIDCKRKKLLIIRDNCVVNDGEFKNVAKRQFAFLIICKCIGECNF